MEILRETIWGGTPYLHERAVRVHLEELPPEVREDLEDFFGGDLPDPVDLVAGQYEVDPGDGSCTWPFGCRGDGLSGTRSE
jgi:hypothetical protein